MKDVEAEGPPNLFDVSVELRARFSLYGIMRFDGRAVATALRSGTLTKVDLENLASFIEGSHRTGIKLAIKGQGKGWKPMFERAKAFDRLMAIGKFVDQKKAEGCTPEEAVIDAAIAFNLSEPTIFRDLSLYRHVPEEDRIAIMG